MIRLTRIRTVPPVHVNFIGLQKKQFEKELLINQRRIWRGEIDKHPWVSDRWKKAKPQLAVETNGKCAYCEAPWDIVAYGDVEHFRPKSRYWWLAYCYDNYLVSCTLCNSHFKKAKFPIKNAKMRGPIVRRDTTDKYIDLITGQIYPDPLDNIQVNAYIQGHEQERPLLINPYIDEPSDYFSWSADGITQEVKITPEQNNPDTELMCDAAIKYYGLNRKELLDHRWWEYEQYWIFRSSVEEGRLSPRLVTLARQAIEKMRSSRGAFAGMIRFFDQLPLNQLPSPLVT